MSLGDLYHKDVLRLAAAAVGAARLSAPDATVVRVNPICGDKITLDVRSDGERVSAIGYEVKACVLCQASASILGKAAPGTDRAALETLTHALREMLAGSPPALPAPFEAYVAMQPVADHRSRHACVFLPLNALLEALETADEHRPK